MQSLKLGFNNSVAQFSVLLLIKPKFSVSYKVAKFEVALPLHFKQIFVHFSKQSLNIDNNNLIFKVLIIVIHFVKLTLTWTEIHQALLAQFSLQEKFADR